MKRGSRKRQATVELATRKRLRASGLAKQLGFKIVRVEVGRVVLRMRVREQHKQIHRVLHGGVLAALADTAGGLASFSAASGPRVATIEMKINYLEAVAGGTVEADARVVRIGKHIAVVDCDIRQTGGRRDGVQANRGERTGRGHKARLVGKALMSFFVGPFSGTSEKALAETK